MRPTGEKKSTSGEEKRLIECCSIDQFNRKENGDIGERAFEDYDVELINPPMLRLREDLSV